MDALAQCFRAAGIDLRQGTRTKEKAEGTAPLDRELAVGVHLVREYLGPSSGGLFAHEDFLADVARPVLGAAGRGEVMVG